MQNMTFIKHPRLYFLIDGIGAFFSFSVLMFLVAPFESFFGMPKESVYILGSIALSLAIYSLSCSAINMTRWKIFLRIIAILNTIYVFVSLSFMIKHWEHLRMFGYLYFISEKIVVLSLAGLEWKLSGKEKD